MNRDGIKSYLLIFFIVCLAVLLSIKAWADDPYLTFSPLLTDQEIDNLLAPIALYPDPLLAQMLPASTYPAEITDAYDWLNSGGAISEIDRQNWDESVKAIAHYPNILKMMAGNGGWTADLGSAFLNQPEDITRSIQRLRWKARDAGNLGSSGQQTVSVIGDYIEIIPAQPQYIYVPLYDPSVIYVQRWYPGRPPFITFGLGLAIGGWLTMDFDWGQRHVVYHGWNRPGWVNHARPYVQVSNVYINRSRPYINNTWRHDAAHGSPDSYQASRPVGGLGVRRSARIPEIKGRTVTQPRSLPSAFGPRGDARSFSNRGKESLGIVASRPTTPSQDLKKQPTIPALSISQPPARPAPGISKQPELPAPGVSKGTPQARPARESVQPPRTPSVTFGGYRGANEAKGQSLRGQASRKSSEEGIKPPAAPVTKVGAPERKDGPKGSAPAGRDDTRAKPHR
jgi:hypothetical protein